MRKKSRNVLVGLSGGVDSAVAAMLLVEGGFNVTGITMAIYGGTEMAPQGNACYGPGEAEDILRAEKVAAHLGIPFHVINCVDAYAAHVLGYFRETYLTGGTPNPCIRCNAMMKFSILPARAKSKGLAADFFATGHYVRTAFSQEYRRRVLLRGVDHRRDQSYFLYRLTAEQIESAIFPLGDMDKRDVRTLAKRAGLPGHDHPDSQDFYSGDYRDLLGVPPLEGSIVDKAGNVLGKHKGYWNFTPGQRRGLGVSLGEPAYVLSVDPVRNHVVVGNKSEASVFSCQLADMHFHIPLQQVCNPLTVRLRSSQEAVAVTVQKEDKSLWLAFTQAQQGVAPGQSAVLYDGDIVIGGGIICSTA